MTRLTMARVAAGFLSTGRLPAKQCLEITLEKYVAGATVAEHVVTAHYLVPRQHSGGTLLGAECTILKSGKHLSNIFQNFVGSVIAWCNSRVTQRAYIEHFRANWLGNEFIKTQVTVFSCRPKRLKCE